MNRQIILFLLTGLLWPGSAHAQRGWFWGAPIGRTEPSVDYEVSYSPGESVHGQDADLAQTDYAVNILIPVEQTELSDWHVWLGFRDTWYDTSARFPDQDIELPDHFYQPEIGGAWRRQLNNGWMSGILFSLGSPSDKPFDSFEEYSIGVTGLLKTPIDDQNAWLFFLNYASNREFLRHVPIPGVARLWQPRNELRALVGIPFAQIEWQPRDNWSLDFSYFVPRTIHAAISYHFLPEARFYTRFDWDNTRFFRSRRDNHDHRLFHYQKQVSAGLKYEFNKTCSVDGYAGFAFDRFMFEGEDYDDRGRDRIDIKDGFIFGLQGRLRF
ncbi:MAG: hypothetical protein JW860_07220 [Sedimentisphaerales bacterium]|nr:hypothetical protein [Sedimentisphaerales bacterium]